MYLIDSHFIAGLGQLRDVTCKNYRLQLKICCCEVQRQPLGIVSLCGEFSPPLRQVRFILQQKINEARCRMRRNTLAIAPVPPLKTLPSLLPFPVPSLCHPPTIRLLCLHHSFYHPWKQYLTILTQSFWHLCTLLLPPVQHPLTILLPSFLQYFSFSCTILVPSLYLLFTYSPSLRHHRTISFYHPSSIIWPSLHHPSTIFVPSCYHLLGWLFLVLGWQPMFVNALTWTTSGGKKRENQQSRRLYGWYHFPAPKLLKINTFTRTILSTEKVWGSDFQFWSIVNCIRRLEFRMAFAKLKWKHTNQNTKDFQQKLIQ